MNWGINIIYHMSLNVMTLGTNWTDELELVCVCVFGVCVSIAQ